jgi:hypothetical protein
MLSGRATNQSRVAFPRNKPESSELDEAQRRVKAAEEQLERAKAEAAEEKPKRPERHITTTWQSFEDYRRDRPLWRAPLNC